MSMEPNHAVTGNGARASSYMCATFFAPCWRTNIAKVKARGQRLMLIAAFLAILGCDTFFGVHTVVTNATTGEPVHDATVRLVLDKGVNEPDVVITTGTNGIVDVLINEHSSVWATMTVAKPGYQTWSTQFRGRPRRGFVIKLEPQEKLEAETACTVIGAIP